MHVVCKWLGISSRFLNAKFYPQESYQPNNGKRGEESKSLFKFEKQHHNYNNYCVTSVIYPFISVLSYIVWWWYCACRNLIDLLTAVAWPGMIRGWVSSSPLLLLATSLTELARPMEMLKYITAPIEPSTVSYCNSVHVTDPHEMFQ